MDEAAKKVGVNFIGGYSAQGNPHGDGTDVQILLMNHCICFHYFIYIDHFFPSSSIVISVVGKDKVGIIFNVCKYLAGNQINILDIAQTIVSDWFNMIMIVNIQDSHKDFATIASELKQIGAYY